MKGIKDYIIHIQQRFTDTYKTEGGLELYGDHRWSAKEMANTIVDVIETPFFGKSPIKKGYQVFIDSTVVFNQTYQKTGDAESPFLVDKEKGWFKVSNDLIIAYRENKDSEWIAFGDNNLLSRIKNIEEAPKKIPSLIITPDSNKPKYKKGLCTVFIASTNIQKLDVEKDMVVHMEELTAVDVTLDGKKYVWVKDRHVIGISLNTKVA
jgi:co-chaperonin GroES (HSP10)